MKTLILAAEDMHFLANRVGLDQIMDEMIERLGNAFASYHNAWVQTPARSGFNYQQPATGLVEWMPAMRDGKSVHVKTVGYHPQNGSLYGLPTILATQATYSTANGHLVSLMDASFTTALRTGAASAVASKLLARPDSAVLGIIGAGAQAVTQLHALSRLFPIRKVYLFDTDVEAMQSFERRIQRLGLTNLSFTSGLVGGWISKIDILVTATSVAVGEGPVFQDLNIPQHLHINAVGSDFPGKFEIPKSLLRRALVCPDFTEQAVAEGECQRLSTVEIGPDLCDLTANRSRYQDASAGITVFDSTGWSLEDMVAMDLFAEYANSYQVGTEFQIETLSEDYRDPYQFTDDYELRNCS